MSTSTQLKVQRGALLETVVDLAAVELGMDVSEPMTPSLRNVIWREAMAAYHAWRDLIAVGAQVEATSQFEKSLVTLCHLDIAIGRALHSEALYQ